MRNKIARNDTVEIICNGRKESLIIGSCKNECLEYACIGKIKGEEFEYLGVKIKILNILSSEDLKSDEKSIPRVSDFFDMPDDRESLKAERLKFGYVNDATERMISYREQAEKRAMTLPTMIYGQNSVKGIGAQGEFIEPFSRVVCTDYVDLNEYRQFRLKPYEIRLDYSLDNTDKILSIYIGLHNVYDTIVDSSGIQYRLLDKTHVLQWKTCIDQIVDQDENGFIKIQPKYISDNLNMTLESLLHDLSGQFKYNGKKYTLKLRRSYSFDWKTGVSYETEYNENENKDITDPFLRKVLSDKRRQHQATNIIFSIQKEQRRIMYESVSQNLIVQGCAGSGKTMILMHRISILLSQKNDWQANNILILTPNDEFAQSLQYLSAELEITKVPRKSIDTFYREAIKAYLPNHQIAYFFDEQKKYSNKALQELYSKQALERTANREKEIIQGYISSITATLEKFDVFLTRHNIKHELQEPQMDSPYKVYCKITKILDDIKESMSKDQKSISDLVLKIGRDKKRVEECYDKINNLQNKMPETALTVLEKIILEKETSKEKIKSLDFERQMLLEQMVQLEEFASKPNYVKSNGEIDFDSIYQSGNPALEEIASKIRRKMSKIRTLEEKRSETAITELTVRRSLRQEITVLEDELDSLIQSIPKGGTKQEIDQKMQKAEKLDLDILQHTKKVEACNCFIKALTNVSNNGWPNLEKLPGHEILDIYIQEYQDIWRKLITNTERAKNIQEIINENTVKLETLELANSNENFQKQFTELKEMTNKLNPERFIDATFTEIFYKRKTNQEILSCRIEYIYFLQICIGYFQHAAFSGVKLVCIDEAQDISPQEFLILKDLLGKNVHFNLYGDELQFSTHYKEDNVPFSWDSIKESIGAKLYVSNINYRNAQEIVEYCNKQFQIAIQPLGLHGSVYDGFDKAEEFADWLKEHIQNYNNENDLSSTVIIIKSLDQKTETGLERILHKIPLSFNHIQKNKISVFDIKSVKGMEFRYGIVFIVDMEKSERYIAYTRAMEKLILCKFHL